MGGSRGDPLLYQLIKERIFFWAKGNIPFSRRTKPAAKFQMIDSSATTNSWHEVNVDPYERGYEPDCEQSEIAVPVLVI